MRRTTVNYTERKTVVCYDHVCCDSRCFLNITTLYSFKGQNAHRVTKRMKFINA